MMDFRFYVDIIKDFLKNSSYKQIGRFLAGRGGWRVKTENIAHNYVTAVFAFNVAVKEDNKIDSASYIFFHSLSDYLEYVFSNKFFTYHATKEIFLVIKTQLELEKENDAFFEINKTDIFYFLNVLEGYKKYMNDIGDGYNDYQLYVEKINELLTKGKSL